MNIWDVFLTTLILPKELMLWNSDFQTLLTIHKKIIHHNLVNIPHTHMHREVHTYPTKTSFMK